MPGWGALLAAALATAAPAVPAAGRRVLDDLESPAAWSTVVSDDVKASLRPMVHGDGKALCLDYDFNGVSGYAVARRALPMRYPANYQYLLSLRGKGPANNVEFKLVDATGDNVWWTRRPDYSAPDAWTALKLRKRQIDFAWGPTGDRQLRQSAFFEVVVSAGKGGGRGELCFDDLAFEELPPDDSPPPGVRASASGAERGGLAAMAVDGDLATAWQGPPGRQSITFDLGRLREFGGLSLRWREGRHARDYAVQLSDDGRSWRDGLIVRDGNGGVDSIALPEAQARWVRLQLQGPAASGVELAEATIEPLAFSATPNAFLQAVAARARRGRFPRAFSGEQSYWTLVGIDGGREQGLIGEDGAIEAGKGGFSIEPFVLSDDTLASWADVVSTQSLQEGYLPIPSVDWSHRQFALGITAFAQGQPGHSRMHVRYRLRNIDSVARELTLALAVRPMQVNPPSQFLNTVGGFSALRAVQFDGGQLRVDGRVRALASVMPSAVFATAFAQGMVEEQLAARALPASAAANDLAGLASGAMLFRLQLAPGESREVDLLLPLEGDLAEPEAQAPEAAQEAVATQWREKLNRVSLRLPARATALHNTLRTALANMLISRSGPRLQPGTRSYARAWIRDGAMISEGLLRLGQAPVAEAFIRWYAPTQFANGKVPCCVDDRGSDPVPENDSQGEFIYAVAELFRYTGDRALLAQMWPRVQAAVRYMDTLRASETGAANPAFRGLMPASISHEGYSAKPMHSYWDDFWALRGYKDAAAIASWLGHAREASEIAAARDQFRGDLLASLQLATTQHGIDFLPGAAELGDFDATSTTIALAPGGEQQHLPPTLLRNTFQRYWTEFEQRRDGARQWKDYTPYELRNVGAFVRLGWRERALQALEFFFAGQQPAGWNQWAEVVAREPRKPFFLGDLPHAWVASDYVRSVLDMFCYAREPDDALVIAAGIPLDWLAGNGVSINGLLTPYGPLAFTLLSKNGKLLLNLPAGTALPPGGLVFPWPGTGQPGEARVNGRLAQWRDNELRIRALPAWVEISVGQGLVE